MECIFDYSSTSSEELAPVKIHDTVISTVKKSNQISICKNDVRDTTFTENIPKPSENGDDVEFIQMSDDLALLRNYKARFSKDPQSVIDNLINASENGDDVVVGVTYEEAQHIITFQEEQVSIGSMKFSSAPQNCFSEQVPRPCLSFRHFEYVLNYLAKQKSLHILNHPSVEEDIFSLIQIKRDKRLSTHSQRPLTSSGNTSKFGNSKLAVDSATKIQPNLKDAKKIVNPNQFPDSNGHRLSQGHVLSATSTSNCFLATKIGPKNQGNRNNATNATLSTNRNVAIAGGCQNQPKFNDAMQIVEPEKNNNGTGKAITAIETGSENKCTGSDETQMKRNIHETFEKKNAPANEIHSLNQMITDNPENEFNRNQKEQKFQSCCKCTARSRNDHYKY